MLNLMSRDDYSAHRASYKSYHRDGELLAQQSLYYLAGTANIGGNHWISFVINSASHRILISDSMLKNSGGIDALKKGAYRHCIESIKWWLHHSHTANDLLPPSYTVDVLHVHEQTDRSSCGLYAHNSLDRYFNPQDHIQLVPSSMKNPRTLLFTRIAC